MAIELYMQLPVSYAYTWYKVFLLDRSTYQIFLGEPKEGLFGSEAEGERPQGVENPGVQQGDRVAFRELGVVHHESQTPAQDQADVPRRIRLAN